MRLRALTGAVAALAALAALTLAPAGALASGSPQNGPLPTTAPFQQCTAVYLDPSCGYLIDVTDSGSRVLVDASIGYYEGQDDVLVGIQNDSSAPVSQLHIGVAGSGYGSFGFDGDGLCTPGGNPVPADCPFGPVGDPGDYWGPDAQLTADPNPCPGASAGPCADDGTVTFPTPLAPGQYTYFSLESPFSGATVITGTQNDVIQTSLSDGTNSGVHLTDSAPTNITDTATINPAQINGSSPTGSVVFTVYSDPACTNAVAGPFTEPIASGANTADTSDHPFGASLPTNATYYVQATYSGDSNFNATTTNCGDETFSFGTPPSKPAATIATSLVASNGTTGPQIEVPTGTSVHDTASVTYNGQPQTGRITYYVFTDASCTQQVAGVNLGSGASTAAGAYPPSSTVTLANGTYYLQAIYSGNSTVAGGRSQCGAEVLTVAPPCNCLKVSGYLSAFHVFGARSTRLQFTFHSAIFCTAGPGGCSGSVAVLAPAPATFLGSRGQKARFITLSCAGPCSAMTVQPPVTLQWLAFKTIRVRKVIHRGRRRIVVHIKRTVPDPRFLPKGRARHTLLVTLVESCNGVSTRIVLRIHFDRHGQVDYRGSDLNGDGKPDGGRLTDANGFA